MKMNKLKFLGIIGFTAAIVFTLTGCPNGSGTDGGSPSPVYTFTVTDTAQWEAAFTTIKNQGSGTAGNPKTYTITVNGNVPVDYVNFGNVSNITITLNGNGKLYRTSGYQILDIGSGIDTTVVNQTIIIDSPNLTLEGRTAGKNGATENSYTSVVIVWKNANLELRNGTITGNTGNAGVSVYGTFTMSGGTITGNTASYGSGVKVDLGGTFTMSGGSISGNASSNSGGGVYVDSNGTFTMNGGTITGNTASSGGGVYMRGGTFTMNSGEISGNTGSGVYVYSGDFTMSGGSISSNTAATSYANGGGVYMSFGTFTMSGGRISGNTASSSSSYACGGGVYVTGTFAMEGGTISGNTAIYSSSYSYSFFYSSGGVYVGGIFSKTGGTIYGYSESDTVNSNVVKSSSGTVQNYKGHAVFASGNTGGRYKDTTAGPGDNLFCNDGSFSGGWDN
jgi:hypothetical protein